MSTLKRDLDRAITKFAAAAPLAAKGLIIGVKGAKAAGAAIPLGYKLYRSRHLINPRYGKLMMRYGRKWARAYPFRRKMWTAASGVGQLSFVASAPAAISSAGRSLKSRISLRRQHKIKQNKMKLDNYIANKAGA